MPEPNNRPEAGVFGQEASPAEIFLAGYAAHLVVDFPGLQERVAAELDFDAPTIDKYEALVCYRSQAEAALRHAFATVEPEDVSPWPPADAPSIPKVYDHEKELSKIELFLGNPQLLDRARRLGGAINRFIFKRYSQG